MIGTDGKDGNYGIFKINEIREKFLKKIDSLKARKFDKINISYFNKEKK